jgi:hypothetical protein
MRREVLSPEDRGAAVQIFGIGGMRAKFTASATFAAESRGSTATMSAAIAE